MYQYVMCAPWVSAPNGVYSAGGYVSVLSSMSACVRVCVCVHAVCYHVCMAAKSS